MRLTDDEFLALVNALEASRQALDPMSEARSILDGLLNNVLDDWERQSGGWDYPLIDLDDSNPRELRGVVFDTLYEAEDYLDTIPVGGRIVDLGDGYYGVEVDYDSGGASK